MYVPYSKTCQHNLHWEWRQLLRHIRDTGDNSPTYAKVRQISEGKLKAPKEEFTALLQSGITKQSNFPWSSTLHMVPKSAPEQWRTCRDDWNLNLLTKPDRYLMSNINSFFSKLGKENIFSKIDLLQAYNQIPVRRRYKENSSGNIVWPFWVCIYWFWSTKCYSYISKFYGQYISTVFSSNWSMFWFSPKQKNDITRI